jgi:hypothetical protein
VPLAEGLEYGTVPDWIAGIGTATATIIAVLILNREVQARREAEAAELYRQARRVLCRLEFSNPGLDELMVVIFNGSDEPIFDCRIQVELPPEAAPMIDPVLPYLEESGIERIGLRRLELREPNLAPGQHRKSLMVPNSLRMRSSVWFLFTDAAGHRWQRSTSGQLSRAVDRSEVDTSSAAPARVGCGVIWHGPRR